MLGTLLFQEVLMAEVRPGVHCVQNVRKKRHALPRHPCLSPEEAPCQGGPAGQGGAEGADGLAAATEGCRGVCWGGL